MSISVATKPTPSKKFIDLPLNNTPYRLISVGPITKKTRGYSEPIWNTLFRTTDKFDPYDTSIKTFSAQFAAPYAQYLKLGSIWKNQSIYNETGSIPEYKVNIIANHQKILWRVDDNYHFHFSDHPIKNSIPYLFVKTPEDGFDGLMIRCAEIIRYYFTQSGYLSKYIFDFSKAGSQNSNLFHHKNTGWIKGENIFQIIPNKKISSKKDIGFIARRISDPVSRSCLAQISASARIQNIHSSEIWPHTLAPIAGEIEWTITGEPRVVAIQKDGKGLKYFDILGATHLIQCSYELNNPKIRILLPPSTKKPKSALSFLRQTIRKIKNRNQITSTIPPGASEIEEITPIELNSTEEEQLNIEIHQAKDQSEIENIQVSPISKEIDKLSALEEQGTDNNVGAISITPNLPEPKIVRVSEDQYIEDIIDRDKLPDIFEEFDLEKPVYVNFDIGSIPPEFNIFLNACLNIEQNKSDMLRSHWNIEINQSKLALFNSISLLDLPEAWGANVLHPTSPSGKRRALTIEFTSGGIHGVLIDIEPKTKSEFAGYLIIGGPQKFISLDVISKVIHWRLFNETEDSWPDYDTHNGNFRYSVIKHWKSLERMSNIIANKLLAQD